MKIIVWSGGADSTLLLYDAVLENPRQVLAISLEHPQLGPTQLALQRAAQQRFKDWMRHKHGGEISHYTYEIRFAPENEALGAIGQYGLFLSTLFPYMTGRSPRGPATEVQLGYIRDDIFWHYRESFVAAFNALAKLSLEPDMHLSFPLEWEPKNYVLDRLFSAGVPTSAWWTCDEPVKKKACGVCLKCAAIAAWKPPEKLQLRELQKAHKKDRQRRRVRASRRTAS